MATGFVNSSNESLVKDELSKFLNSNGLKDSIESVDEVVLSYVISILEDLGDDSNAEENIDVDQFVEMMDAYIPGFSSVDSVVVCEWMFKLASDMSRADTDDHTESNFGMSSTNENLNACISEVCNGEICDGETSEDKQNHNTSETMDEVDDSVRMLLEMFPASCTLEITHCLNKSDGNVEEAAQMVLDRQENGLSLTPKQTKSKEKTREDLRLLEDPNLKEIVMQRYGYQDTNEDKKTFKPVTPKTESKKMIRYLDNRVVSTKGERFTEIKKEDSEEMKKTYVNLKPARKYRFH